MKNIAQTLVLLSVVSIFVIAGGCGKKADQEDSAAQSSTEHGDDTNHDQSLSGVAVPYAPEIADGGFEPVYYGYFPSPVGGKRGHMILYRSKKGGKDGGMIFVQEVGPEFEWVWHWYFEDDPPKSVEYADVNRDGLWDVKLTTASNRSLELIDDDEFTLTGNPRTDKIALNGTSTPPLDEHRLWQCFDGVPTTAWMSSMKGGEKPYIEVASPLGLVDGILSIRSLGENQPRKCAIYADGKKKQDIELEETTDAQLFQLKTEVKTAKKIRLVVNSCYGDCEAVAIAELSIK